MLGSERQNAILKIVNERSSVAVSDLMTEFDASESTIRRDLNVLDKMGYLIKVHGGAMSKDSGFKTIDDDIHLRQDINREDKISIARYAAGLIAKNDIVYIDAGSTTELIAEYLETKEAVVVTNALEHARKFAAKGITTYILGGECKALTDAIVGEQAMLDLEKFNFTKGFFGTNGVNVKNGFTTPDVREALIKKTAMSRTKEKYVLCDKSKFSKISSVTFGDFQSSRIITTKIEDNAYKGLKNIIEVL